ncbi:MAG: ABC transporter substrate-binding protein [Eubacterium sp.]|nr:ABC transporter substrate-binding protein [Eubacterium sp.]
MKKRISCIVVIIISLLNLCSCSKNNDIESAETLSFGENINWIDTSENQSTPDPYPSYKEIQEKYPDKVVLMWVFEGTGYDYEAPVRVNKINEYLNEQGYDFAVCFYPIDYSVNGEYYYTDRVVEMIENGGQVDIIYTSFTTVGEAGNNAYHKYIYNGLFEPLDEYFKTETGKKLYDLMPENHWAGLRVNGKIYGVDGSMHTLSNDYGYYVNSELADKYGFDISKPIGEQLDILQAVKENEMCDVFAMYNNLNIQAYYSDIQEITFAVYWDETEKCAKSLLENNDYLEKINFFKTLKSSGFVIDMGIVHTNNFFILQDNYPGGKIIYADSNLYDVNYWDNIISAYPVFNENTSVKASYMATGICSSSQYKDMAFELLALTQTDPDLNNLLSFGIEGTDYTLEDGRILTVGNRISLDRFVNKMICHPFEEEPLDMAAAYTKVFENAKIHPNIDFAFDGRGTEQETADTFRALADNTFLHGDSFEESLAELEENLEKGGVQKIIDECNKQYEEYVK